MAWWGNWWGFASAAPAPDYSDAASLEAAIRERAGAHAGLSALIDTRCYADDGKQEPTAPFLIFSIDNEDRTQRTMGTRPYIIFAKIKMEAFASLATGRVALESAVVDAFDQWSGTSASIVVKHCTVAPSGKSDIYGLDQEGQLYAKTFELSIAYVNPDPS